MRVVVLLFAGAACLVAQEQRPTFGVKVEGVQVDVLVTQRGRPVAGLTADDFELRDNGVVQRIDSVAREDVALDVFLVLDASGSVAGEPLASLTAAARIAIDTLPPQDRVALLTFTHRLGGPTRLSADKAAVRSAIGRIVASGSTSLLDALYAALVLRHDSPNRVLVIAFTDGLDTSSWLLPSMVLDLAKQTDVVVYGVALARDEAKQAQFGTRSPGGGIDLTIPMTLSAPPAEQRQPPAVLEEIASAAGGRVLRTSDPRRLRDLFAQALGEMKTRYVLSYSPRDVRREGWHTLDVSLTRRKADVTARRGYFVPR